MLVVLHCVQVKFYLLIKNRSVTLIPPLPPVSVIFAFIFSPQSTMLMHLVVGKDKFYTISSIKITTVGKSQHPPALSVSSLLPCSSPCSPKAGQGQISPIAMHTPRYLPIHGHLPFFCWLLGHFCINQGPSNVTFFQESLGQYRASKTMPLTTL